MGRKLLFFLTAPPMAKENGEQAVVANYLGNLRLKARSSFPSFQDSVKRKKINPE